jgi:protein-disulfide isomerase
MRLGTLVLLLFFGLSQIGYAQTTGALKDEQPKDGLSSLRTEIRTLQAEQEQIISQLHELKQILLSSGHPADSIAQQGPQPAPNLDIRGEDFRGDADARVAIVEYADFECPYCGEYERKTFPQILSDYIETGKVKYFYRDLPLPVHTRALPAARAARCAGEQGKYWEMHDSLFAKQNALSDPAILDRAQTLGLDGAKFTECVSSERYTAGIQNRVSEAQKMRIDGTPTFFLGVIGANGDVTIDKRFNGNAPFDAFKAELDKLLTSKS